MEIVDRCKDKLEQFRIKELKDILSRVGISKQGKKQDLIDRVLAVLYDEGSKFLYKHINGKEELVAIIDDIHRKMKDEAVNDSEAKKQNSVSNKKKKLQEEAEVVKIRCICGHSGLDSPIQCADLKCNVWQHTGCALSLEQDIEKQLCTSETKFFCQTCRVQRADPFWETIDHLLYPVKLPVTSIQNDGSKPFRQIKRTFQLSKEKTDLLARAEYDVQVWCMLLSDSVPFRIQWPIYAELLVNDVPMRTYNRPGSQPLGANGRDDGVKITLYLVDGVNKISLSGSDDRNFCLGVRLVKKQTLQQVLSMIPVESVGESFEDALARVKRCTGGGVVEENEESDSDIEVVTDSIPVSLRCPMSGCRMKTAGRFRPCVHMGCFDLETFIQMNERSRKWQCPICLKNYTLEDVAIDPYFNRILNMMRDCREDISDIELKLDGSWRVKNEVATKDLSLWHNPDGSLSIASGPGRHDNTTPGEQKNMVAVGQNEDTSKLNLLVNEITNCEPEVITMSSSSSEDCRNYQTGNLVRKDDEVSSYPLTNAQVNITDVIVLSDSEDENASIQHDSSTAMAGCDRSDDLQNVLRASEDIGTYLLPIVSNTATHNLDAVTGFDQTPENLSVCQQMTTSDKSHIENLVLDYSLVPDDVIASSSVNEEFVKSDENNLHEHNHSATASVSGNMNPVHYPNSTGEERSSYEGCNGDEARVQTPGTNLTDSIVYVRSKKRLSLPPNPKRENGLEIDVDRKREGDPFSFPTRPRSRKRQQN